MKIYSYRLSIATFLLLLHINGLTLASADLGALPLPDEETVASAGAATAVATAASLPPDPIRHKVLIIAHGGNSIFAALNELRYVERQTGKRIGELFDAAAGGSLAGSFVAAAVFKRDREGRYQSIDDIYGFVNDNFEEYFMRENTGCCIWRPRHTFDGDRLSGVLTRYFERMNFSDLDKHVIIPVRIKRTTTDRLLSSFDAQHDRREDFLLKDVVRASSSTKHQFKAVLIRSLAGTPHRFGDLWPTVPNTTLPILLKLTREFGDTTWSHYSTLVVGHTANPSDSLTPTERIMEQTLQQLLGERYVRPTITLPEGQDGFFDREPETHRRLIHASNALDRTNVAFRDALDRFVDIIGERRVLPPLRYQPSVAILIHNGRIVTAPVVSSAAQVGGTLLSAPLPTITEADDEEERESPVSVEHVDLGSPTHLERALGGEEAPAGDE